MQDNGTLVYLSHARPLAGQRLSTYKHKDRMPDASDTKPEPEDDKKEEPAAAAEVAAKEEQQKDKDGETKMPPPAASAKSGSDAIKAAVKAGNINIHQEERE